MKSAFVKTMGMTYATKTRVEDAMTELLAHTDSYLREFDADVIELNAHDNSLALHRTAFFPGGGGQPCDVGELVVAGQSIPVTRVKRQGGYIWHWVQGTLPPKGDPVHGIIDWERRYELMRTHTALHILCGVVWRDYRAQVTGGNMEPRGGRMDFEFETLRHELVEEIEDKINEEVRCERPVHVKVLPREVAFQIPDLIRTKVNLLPQEITEVRVVEIEGLDLQADGGTHVANTREVGRIRISDYKSKGKINKRIWIRLDP